MPELNKQGVYMEKKLHACRHETSHVLFFLTFSSFPAADSPNILLISYENLKKQTYSSIQTIAKFLGYDLSEDTVQKIVTQVSFDKMKANPSCNNAWFDKYRRPGEMFMRKGIIGDWKELFTSEQSAYVDQQVAKKLSPLGLVFEYN